MLTSCTTSFTFKN